MKLAEYKTSPPIMKKYLPGSVIFAGLMLVASAVFGQELSSTTPPTLSTIDIISAFDQYNILKKEDEYTNLFDSPTEGYKPRASVLNFFNRTEAENFDFLYGKLQTIDDKLNQLLRICSK